MPREFALRSMVVLVVFFIRLSAGSAQEPADGLQVLLQGNDRFGTRLLQDAHSDAPDKNIVVAPLSLTILLGAIQTNSQSEESRKEFAQVFGRGEYPGLRIASRMILAAMDKPQVVPQSPYNMNLDKPRAMVESESLWIVNRLLYRSPKAGPPLLDSRFIESASKDFGLQLVNTGDKNPSESALRRSREQVGRVPAVSPLDQVWLSSGFHMHQTWEELFMESQPEPGEFRLESGVSRTVLKVESQLRKLPHLKNDQFEAVGLPCGRVLMLVALPTPGTRIQELEQWLVAHPDALNDMSTARYGSVTFPEFEIKTTARLENSLKAMGITDIFQHLDGITHEGLPARMSRIENVAQAIDFGAHKHGVRADAETMIGAVPAGILMTNDTFHVSIDRPFVFFVRDTATHALVLAGALMDPGNAARDASRR